MDPLQALEIKAFVPARDFALAQRFYRSLGFEIPWHDEHLAYVRHGSTSFLLQHYDEPAFCASFQMHLLVSDADAWYARARALAAEFGVAVGEPADRPWAMRDFTLLDPSGVLWRIAHHLPKAPQGSAPRLDGRSGESAP